MEIQNRYVVYIVVNNSLKMSAGKVAAQVGHGIGELYEYHYENANKTEKKNFQTWKQDAKTKIVLSANFEEFKELKKYNSVLIRDAGFTEVEPGSETVMVFLPMRKSEQLKELKKLKKY